MLRGFVPAAVGQNPVESEPSEEGAFGRLRGVLAALEGRVPVRSLLRFRTRGQDRDIPLGREFLPEFLFQLAPAQSLVKCKIGA